MQILCQLGSYSALGVAFRRASCEKWIPPHLPIPSSIASKKKRWSGELLFLLRPHHHLVGALGIFVVGGLPLFLSGQRFCFFLRFYIHFEHLCHIFHWNLDRYSHVSSRNPCREANCPWGHKGLRHCKYFDVSILFLSRKCDHRCFTPPAGTSVGVIFIYNLYLVSNIISFFCRW